MIQDIAPHKFDNSHRILSPGPEDFALCIHGNQTLLAAAEDGFSIPTFARLEALLPAACQDAVYLFSIDERPYFLVDLLPELILPDDSPFQWKKIPYFRTMQPEYQAFACITATQIWRWRRSRRYCGRCGTPTVDSPTERALVCPKCGQTEYPKICPAVIVAITNGDKLLVTHYSDRPNIGYALVAGFVEIGETFEETIRREVMEEVGLKVKNIRYFKSQPWAFSDTEMVGFFADLDGDDTVHIQESELADAIWLHRDDIPHEERSISVAGELKMAFKYGTWPKV